MFKEKTHRDSGHPKPRTRFGKNVDLPSNPPVLHPPTANATRASHPENADRQSIGQTIGKLWLIRKVSHSDKQPINLGALRAIGNL